MNKTTLIIPDIHHKWAQAEKIISAVGADEVIFIGDYFDDFNDTPEMVTDTCDWLEASVNKPNRIHLYGNHDQSYGFGFKALRCSGYAQWKQFIIDDTLPKETWSKLKWYHFLDNRWLLCHAGLHKLNIPDKIMDYREDRPKFIQEISEYLDDNLVKGLRKAANNDTHWVLNAGRSRGGLERVGGITWCDYEREFYPVQGLNQIVGHTPQSFGRIKWCRYIDGKVSCIAHTDYSPTPEELDDPNISINIDLDVNGNMHWGTWDGKTFTIGNYKDL